MIVLLLLFWAVAFFVDARVAEGRADRAEAERDELRSRIEQFGPVWRRRDPDFPGSRW
jgi:hypothetical protein